MNTHFCQKVIIYERSAMQKRLYSLLSKTVLFGDVIGEAFKLLEFYAHGVKGIMLEKDSFYCLARNTAFKHNMPHIKDKQILVRYFYTFRCGCC